MDHNIKVSELIFYLARYWAFLALAAFAVGLIVLAIENHKTTVVITRSYRVPIEPTPPEEAPETRHYHTIKGEADGND